MKALLKITNPFCLIALVAFGGAPMANAAQSSAGSGEIAIYTEATGTDVITTADFTHDFDTTDREDAGSFTRSGADITLNRAGHYLAIYNSRFNGAPIAGTEERVEIQSNLSLAGTNLPAGWSQGFIRRQQNHVDAITTGMAVIEAAASDVLQLHSQRTDTTTVGSVTRFPDATGIQLIKLDDVNMSYARLSLAANQTGPTNDTAVKVLYGTPDELDSGFAYTDGSGDLTLADAGKYLVIANSYVTTSNNRIGFVQQLTLDTIPIPGTRTTIYTRGSQSTVEGAAAIGTIIETTAPNQVLSVQGELDGGTFTSDYIADHCALTVVKLPSAAAGTAPLDPDFIRLSHSANQNINTAADIIFDTNIELDPEFTHAVGTSGINVATGGDYLFLGAYYGADDGAARGLSSPGWSINDGSVLNIGQSGRYTRNTGPPEFGNTLGLVASGLTSGDKVEMVTRALAAGGTNNANPVALQGVRLTSLFTDFGVLINPTAVSVAESGTTATYDIFLGVAPTSGSVDITVSSDADTEVSLDGANFFSSVTPSFTAGLTPQTITVRAIDDGDIEGNHVAPLSHAITATGDSTNYPLSLTIPDVTADITDNDVTAVTAVADNSTSNVGEDGTGSEANIAPQTDLLANDTGGVNNIVSAFAPRSDFGATVDVAPDGTFTYDPTTAPGAQALAAGATGTDTFDYTVRDGSGNEDSATVSITVDGANDRPDAMNNTLFDGPLENASSFTSTVDLTANDGAYRTVLMTFPPGSDLRLLPGKVASQSPSVGTPPGNGFPENAFDGNIGTFTHTQSNNDSVDHSWQVDLGQVASLESITLANRNDCCGIRLRDITVRVLDGGGTEIFNSGPLNVDNALGFSGGATETLFVDFAGPIMGQTVIVDRETDEVNTTDARTDNNNAGDVSILSLSEVTLIGSVPGTYQRVTNPLLLNYEAAQTPDAGRWENLGTNAGAAMDWLLTDVTLDSTPGGTRAQITAAYEWDNIADRALLSAPGGDSVHDLMPGDPDTGDATFEFWVKPINTSSVMTIFETGGGSGFGCLINNGVLEAATELDGDPAAKNESYVSYNLLTDTEGLVGGDPTTDFNQYAVTITVGGGLQLFVNGVLVDETTAGVSGDWDGGDGSGLGRFGADNHGGFANGAAGGTYDAPFLGHMAIMRLYSGVLNPAQIFQSFKAVSGDTDIDGDPITVTGVIDGANSLIGIGTPATLPSGALVTISNNTGSFDYNPNGAFDLAPGVTVTDSFTYRVTDGNGETAEADVTLNVTGIAIPVDDDLWAEQGQVRTIFANELLMNDEIPAITPGTYLDLSPDGIAGATWTNQGSAGSGRNATVSGSLSAPELQSNFGALGTAATAASLEDLDPISAADATLEIWFKPTLGQIGKKTIFETGGNGTGFSLVFDPATNEVIATIDGGDDTTQAVVAVVPGVVTTDFNQVFVTFDRDGGAEVGVATDIFEDILSVTLNNDPTTPFDATVDAMIVDPEGDANDWSGTDNSGINSVSGTSARNENFPGMAGEVAIVRAYNSILTPAEMEANYDASAQAITAVSSPSAIEGVNVTLNADGSVTADYSGVSLATPGATTPDSFTYTINNGAGGSITATAYITVFAYTVQENWRIAYYGDPANSGPGADMATAANGLTNLENFAQNLDPAGPLGTLDIDGGAGTIISQGPPSVWEDPADGRFYLQYTRRADFATVGLTIAEEFSRALTFWDPASTVAPPATASVVANGTGADGSAIEALQIELPGALPTTGGKARFGRLAITVTP